MTETLKLTLAQLNPTLGDFAGNIGEGRRGSRGCCAARGRIWLLLPEMFVTGYQAQDLVLRPAFTLRCHVARGKAGKAM